ncbi:helix-turn-helix domain-containing protein [Bacteroidia bacterium]|nr:helix-turn-helix domain-containing protein [Bacteroidia bacterium]
MEIYDNLKTIRLIKGYSQEYMALKLNLKSSKSYCNLEKGQTPLSIDRLIAISKIFNLKVEQILYFSHNKYLSCSEKHNELKTLKDFQSLSREIHLLKIEIEQIKAQRAL